MSGTDIFDPPPTDPPSTVDDGHRARGEESTGLIPGFVFPARLERWLDARHAMSLGELALIVAIVGFALVLGLRGLDTVPTGLHGDEAVTGEEGQRVLDEGWIGVYTGSALGQPTGPFYLTGVSIGLFGSSVWAIRAPSAIAGAATVALLWWVTRRRFDPATGLFAAFALATMTWHLHFSRIGFGVAWWPFVTLAGVAAVDRAIRRDRFRSWLLAGAIVAAGVYVYNSHWAVGLIVGLFLVGWAVRQLVEEGSVALPRLGRAGGVLVGAGLALAPMLSYAADDDNSYFNHFRAVGRTNGEDWIEAGWGERTIKFAGWYVDVWDNLALRAVVDGGDGSGLLRPIPLLFSVLALVGVGVAIMRCRSSFLALAGLVLVLLPAAKALTFDGVTRRVLVLAPFVAVLVAVGAVAIVGLSRQRWSPGAADLLMVGIGLAMVLVGVVPYFTTFAQSQQQRWVFAHELAAVSEVVHHQHDQGPVVVIWYSVRHHHDYESLDFLLDGIEVRPGAGPGADSAVAPSFARAAVDGADDLFVLVGPYADHIDGLWAQYPNGRIVGTLHDPTVIVFRVPG